MSCRAGRPASVVLDDELYLSGIAIHSRPVGSGYRLTYPTRKVGETQFSLFHPIRKPIGLAMEQAIVEKLTGTSVTAAELQAASGGNA